MIEIFITSTTSKSNPEDWSDCFLLDSQCNCVRSVVSGICCCQSLAMCLLHKRQLTGSIGLRWTRLCWQVVKLASCPWLYWETKIFEYFVFKEGFHQIWFGFGLIHNHIELFNISRITNANVNKAKEWRQATWHLLRMSDQVFQKVTFSRPLYLVVSTSQVKAWLCKLNLWFNKKRTSKTFKHCAWYRN